MELLRISTREQLEKYQVAWSLILEEKNNTNPFIEFEWIDKWLEHFGSDVNLDLLVVLEDKNPIAFIPFSYEVKWFGYVYNFVAFGQANYMDFIVSEKNTEQVISFVFDEVIKRRKNVIFNLHGLLQSSKTAMYIEAYLKDRKAGVRLYPVVTPFIAIEGLDLDQYLQKRKKLHGLDRRERRLRSLGEVQLLRGSADEMEYIFDLHAQRWGHRNDTSGFTDQKNRAFFQQLARVNSGSMSVQIEALYLENKMIAFTYGLNCRGRYMGYVLGHDYNFDFFSPGRILVKEKIKKSMDSSVKVLDMSIGHEPYKSDWKTDLDYTKRMVFSSNSIPIKLRRNIIWGKLGLAQGVKKYRWIVLFKRNTMGNVKYILKNIWTKTGFKKIKPFLSENLKNSRMFIYNSKTYFILKKENDVATQATKGNPYIELTIKKVFEDLPSQEVNMQEVGRNFYGSFKGYYCAGQKPYESLFWVNQNVIRIDEIAYVDQLRKRTVYIDKWNSDNLKEVCTFVSQKNKPKVILASVSANVKKDIQALENFGFRIEKKISKKTYLGFNKSVIKEY